MWLAVLSRTFLYTSLSTAGKAAEEYTLRHKHILRDIYIQRETHTH